MGKVVYLKQEKLVPCVDNPREKLDEYSLVPSIREFGIKVPLLVMDNGDGTYTIAKGHRREKAARRIKDGNPKVYEARFPKGIPCEVMPKDTSPLDFALAVADHGESRTLTTDWELYMLARLLTKAGLNRQAVIIEMASLLNVAKPNRDAEWTATVNDLFKTIDDPDADVRESVKAEMEYEKMVVTQHTGVIQRFQSIAKMPAKVEAAFQYTCTGVVPEGYKAEELPKLKGDTYKQLYVEKDGYLKDIKNGETEKFPLFEARWAELIEKQATAKSGTTRKSRSRKEVAATRDGMQSGIAKQILGYACNEADHTEAQVRVLDTKLQMLEWLESECADEFKELSKRYAKWASLKEEALSTPETEEAN